MSDPLADAIKEIQARNAPTAKGGDPLAAEIAARTAKPAPSMIREPQPPLEDVTADDMVFPRPSAVQRASQGVVQPGDEHGFTKAQLAAQAAAARVNTPEAQDPLAQSVIGGMLGAGAGSFAGNLATKAGAPVLGRLIAGGVAGGTSSGVAGGGPKQILKGAALGALTALPAALGARAATASTRAAESTSMPFIRAGNETEQRALLDAGHDTVANVVDKYKLGSIKDPLIARDAANEGLTRAADNLADATRTLNTAKAMNNPELVREATTKVAEATKELNVLRSLEPGITRAATEHQMRLSWVQRLADKPIQTVKNTGSAIIGSPIKAGLAIGRPIVRAADIALAKLFQARQAGTLTPDMLATAASAGVAPNVLAQFAKPLQQQTLQARPMGAIDSLPNAGNTK